MRMIVMEIDNELEYAAREACNMLLNRERAIKFVCTNVPNVNNENASKMIDEIMFNMDKNND